jgi:hypothetical protein
MNISEVAAVLAKVQLGDNRDIDTKGLVLAEWEDTIGDLPFDAAIEGVRMHRRDSKDYLTPAHVRANVRLIQSRWERDARIKSQAARRVLPAPVNTLDRPEFERMTQAAIEQHRAGKS